MSSPATFELPRRLDDVRRLLDRLPEADQKATAAAAMREPQLTKPAGSLGRLEELAAWMAAWQGRHPPQAKDLRCLVFAGNHGVAALGVSAFPAEVTAQMVGNFQAGGAAINQLCRSVGVKLRVIALSLEKPTADFTQKAAMSEAEVMNAFRAGMKAVRPGTDLLCLGEMGIANTSSASALALAIFGGEAADWTGAGTGVVGQALARKTEVVEMGVRRAKKRSGDSLEMLRQLGGRELAAIAGATLAARFLRIPVLLDGFICTAAASSLYGVNPAALDHCQVAHVSAEKAHRQLAASLNKIALLDLGLRLGEASGAALAASVIKAAVACHGGMATFAEAAVSDKGK
jgi:nicotinate-nucleotide--dimethylbenzimidazole phosphoribosyltransferase